MSLHNLLPHVHHAHDLSESSVSHQGHNDHNHDHHHDHDSEEKGIDDLILLLLIHHSHSFQVQVSQDFLKKNYQEVNNYSYQAIESEGLDFEPKLWLRDLHRYCLFERSFFYTSYLSSNPLRGPPTLG